MRATHKDSLGQGETRGHRRRRHSRWLMIACCLPMLAIAVALVAASVVSAGFIVIALVCAVMMAVMMGAMSHGGGGAGHR